MNGLKVKGKSVHDICDTLCQMTGTLTFVIVPGPGPKTSTGTASTTPAKSTDYTQAAVSQSNELPNEDMPEIVVYKFIITCLKSRLEILFFIIVSLSCSFLLPP